MIAAKKLADCRRSQSDREKNRENPQKENKSHQKHFATLAENGGKVRRQEHGNAAWREKGRNPRDKCRNN